jgi:hypothetical protein
MYQATNVYLICGFAAIGKSPRIRIPVLHVSNPRGTHTTIEGPC